jgi:hypothetical protein
VIQPSACMLADLCQGRYGQPHCETCPKGLRAAVCMAGPYMLMPEQTMRYDGNPGSTEPQRRNVPVRFYRLGQPRVIIE